MKFGTAVPDSLPAYPDRVAAILERAQDVLEELTGENFHYVLAIVPVGRELRRCACLANVDDDSVRKVLAAMLDMLKIPLGELDVVELIAPHTLENGIVLDARTTGTIVHVHDEQHVIVEFVDREGATIDVGDVSTDNLRLVEEDEITGWVEG